MTYRQSDPDVQLCVFLFQDADNLISLWQLVEVELNNLHNTICLSCDAVPLSLALKMCDNDQYNDYDVSNQLWLIKAIFAT